MVWCWRFFKVQTESKTCLNLMISESSSQSEACHCGKNSKVNSVVGRWLCFFCSEENLFIYRLSHLHINIIEKVVPCQVLLMKRNQILIIGFIQYVNIPPQLLPFTTYSQIKHICIFKLLKLKKKCKKYVVCMSQQNIIMSTDGGPSFAERPLMTRNVCSPPTSLYSMFRCSYRMIRMMLWIFKHTYETQKLS